MLAAQHFYQPAVWSCHCCPSHLTPCRPHTTVPAPSSSSSALPCTRLLVPQHSPNLLRSPLLPTRLPNHRHPKAAGTPAGKCSPPKLVSWHVCLPQHCMAGRSRAALCFPCSARPYFTDSWRPALLCSTFPRRKHRCTGALLGCHPPAVPPTFPAVAAHRSPSPA